MLLLRVNIAAPPTIPQLRMINGDSCRNRLVFPLVATRPCCSHGRHVAPAQLSPVILVDIWSMMTVRKAIAISYINIMIGRPEPPLSLPRTRGQIMIYSYTLPHARAHTKKTRSLRSGPEHLHLATLRRLVGPQLRAETLPVFTSVLGCVMCSAAPVAWSAVPGGACKLPSALSIPWRFITHHIPYGGRSLPSQRIFRPFRCCTLSSFPLALPWGFL